MKSLNSALIKRALQRQIAAGARYATGFKGAHSPPGKWGPLTVQEVGSPPFLCSLQK